MLRPEIKGEIAQGRFGHGGLASAPRGQRAAAYACSPRGFKLTG
jgi:hypothetical protein